MQGKSSSRDNDEFLKEKHDNNVDKINHYMLFLHFASRTYRFATGRRIGSHMCLLEF